MSDELAAYQRDVVELLFGPEDGGIEARLSASHPRWRVYRRMVRRRLHDCIVAGFPRLVGVVGEPTFERLVERFFAEAAPRSAYLRDIPGEMAQFLERHHDDLGLGSPHPPWLLELARHEAAILEVGYASEELPGEGRVGELSMDRPAVLHPAHRILRARHGVHLLADDVALGERGDAQAFAAVTVGPFALCLYRDPTTHRVRALELSPMAAALLEDISNDAQAGKERPLTEVIRSVAARENIAIDGPFLAGLSDLVGDLVERGLWLGSRMPRLETEETRAEDLDSETSPSSTRTAPRT